MSLILMAVGEGRRKTAPFQPPPPSWCIPMSLHFSLRANLGSSSCDGAQRYTRDVFKTRNRASLAIRQLIAPVVPASQISSKRPRRTG
jgi:hypothetical protein